MFQDTRKKMQGHLDHLHEEYGKLQTGRASAAMIDGVMVDNFGAKTPLKGVASISIPESNQIMIQPWNKDQLPSVEKAIVEANLGLNPQNDGIAIRITIPPLTEERRKDLVKTVHRLAEDARVSIRQDRQDAHNKIKQLKKDGDITEDDVKRLEKDLQDIVDEFNEHIEASAKKKEEDVMKV